jgi:hypothetical protein
MLGIRSAPSGVNSDAVVIAHHRRVGELAAQRLDLDAVSDGSGGALSGQGVLILLLEEGPDNLTWLLGLL